jgi:hypothetical protein
MTNLSARAAGIREAAWTGAAAAGALGHDRFGGQGGRRVGRDRADTTRDRPMSSQARSFAAEADFMSARPARKEKAIRLYRRIPAAPFRWRFFAAC